MEGSLKKIKIWLLSLLERPLFQLIWMEPKDWLERSEATLRTVLQFQAGIFPWEAKVQPPDSGHGEGWSSTPSPLGFGFKATEGEQLEVGHGLKKSRPSGFLATNHQLLWAALAAPGK